MIFIIISHFLADFFVSVFKPLGPYFIERFSIEPRTFVMVLTILSFASSVMQPLFGRLADAISWKYLYVVLTLLLIFLGSSSIGIAGKFEIVAVLILITLLSNSAYHPMGASLIGEFGKSKYLAFFVFSGSLGAATGPFFISWFVERFKLVYFSIVGISMSVLILVFFVFKIRKLETGRKYEQRKVEKPSLEAIASIIPIFLFVAFRSFFSSVASIYLPIYMKNLGVDMTLIGLTLSLGLWSGMFVSILGNHLRDVFGNVFVNLLSVSGMLAFSLILSLESHNVRVIIGSYITMVSFVFLSMSSNVVEAQRKAPNNKAFASSLVMGMAWSTGSLMNFIYSYFMGNNVEFMIKSLWIIALITFIFIWFEGKMSWNSSDQI